jgi:hypothetical protein
MSIIDFHRHLITPLPPGRGELKLTKGKLNQVRNVLAYLMSRLRHDSLRENGNHFQMGESGFVSSNIERMEKQLSEDSDLIKTGGESVCPHLQESRADLTPFVLHQGCYRI